VVPVVTARPLVAQLQALLGALYPAGGGLVRIRSDDDECRAVADGFRLLPTVLLRWLAYDPAAEARVALASWGAADDALQVAAVGAELVLPMVFDRREWQPDPAALDGAVARLSAFPLPVSALIDQATGLAALWLLSEPARVDQRIQALQAALAQAVGGRTGRVKERVPQRTGRRPGEAVAVVEMEATDPRRFWLRLPGSHNFEKGGRGLVVQLVHADPSVRYNITELEAAIGGAERVLPKNQAPTRRKGA